MARTYEEVIDTSYISPDPNLNKFVDAFTEQVQAEYREIFGSEGKPVDTESNPDSKISQ